MTLEQAAIRYAEFLLQLQAEIHDFNLSPDDGSVSRGDLIAELLWISSRIRRLEEQAAFRLAVHPCQVRAPNACPRRH